MKIVHPPVLANFFVAGINYKKTDGEMRGQFAINTEQYAEVINVAHGYNTESFFILSTCNRTEIYGFADDAEYLIRLLCSCTAGNKKTFKKLAYIKNGRDAAEHLFKVGAGLDSQILGDYEIIGQLKKAVKFSSDNGFINCFMQRLFDSVLQASKAIKNSTDISNGSISVSFTAVQYVTRHASTRGKSKILVIGGCKIGRNTCKNLIDYFDNTDITLINRSIEKATDIAAELGLKCAAWSELPQHVNASDIILVATSAPEPVIRANDIQGSDDKLILDLSIPYNVEPAVSARPNVTLINVDELSKTTNENMQKRYMELPKATVIIDAFLQDFISWYQKHQISPILKAVKIRLGDISERQVTATSEISKAGLDAKVQAVIKNMACKMQTDKNYGCYSLEAINEFMLSVAN